MIDVSLQTNDKHDGTIVQMLAIPRRGDTVAFEYCVYKVQDVRYYVSTNHPSTITLILEPK